MAKHRGCKWLHKCRVVAILCGNREVTLCRTVCRRCGKTGTILA